MEVQHCCHLVTNHNIDGHFDKFSSTRRGVHNTSSCFLRCTVLPARRPAWGLRPVLG
jgi:formate-dependent nitrite reductase cytochrome c552 subunit